MSQTICDQYGVGGSYSRCDEFLASLECELEALRHCPGVVGNFAGKKDGSLRNNGFEYVSIVAKSRRDTVEAFKHLHENITFYDKHDPFSPRTSTHVHINVSSLQVDHVKNMVLLYALFEEFFFSLVKPYRRENIHCVPLTDTYLPSRYNRSLDVLIGGWSKYTAFNLVPAASFGSVEFRHMHGTGNVEEVDRWLHVIENLWKLCQKVSINVETLSDPKYRNEWFDLIFFPAPSAMALKNSMPNIIKNSLIDVKFSTIQ